MSKPAKISGTTAKKLKYKKSLQEWQEVEELVMTYQSQFNDETRREVADLAMTSLLERFYPLFKKYLVLIKSSQINFDDAEMKRFVINFIGDPELKFALKKRMIPINVRISINQRFNFVKETYGALDEDEIMNDLKFLFIIMAQRYRQMGRNFCGYLYNAYCYEVARHVKKFIDNPANIHYRNIEYEEHVSKAVEDYTIEDKPFENRLFTDNAGLPDISWINGIGCSAMFEQLTPLERKLIIKYYLEDYNDRQIAEKFGMHINVVNARRRMAVEYIADFLGIDRSQIKRNRKSGKCITPSVS